MNVLDALIEPFQYGFMVRAFLGVSLIVVLSGIIGTFVMLKGLAFIGDAIAHASFGGLVAALLIGIPLHFGALFSAIGTAVIVTMLGRKAKLKPDTSLAILFTGAFSLGVLGLTTRPSFAGDLSALLVGSVLAIRPLDLYWILGAVIVTLIVMAAAFNRLLFVSFDPGGAEAAGLSVSGLHLLLLSLVALAVVVSLQAVGVILVVALLITPAATASLLTRRIGWVIAIAVVFGMIASWTGLYLSYYLSTPPGATIVTVATFLFATTLLIRSARTVIQRRSRPLAS